MDKNDGAASLVRSDALLADLAAWIRHQLLELDDMGAQFPRDNEHQYAIASAQTELREVLRRINDKANGARVR